MKETKICPYCGGEILAVATKCKHCKKWIDKPNEAQDTSKDEPTNVSSINPQTEEIPQVQAPDDTEEMSEEELMAMLKEEQQIPTPVVKVPEQKRENPKKGRGKEVYIFAAIGAVLLILATWSMCYSPKEKATPDIPQTENTQADVSVAVEDTIISDDAGTDDVAVDAEPSSDEIVQDAIARFLKGDRTAVRFTERARRNLSESSWPEVQCSVEGTLDSPSSFKNLVVKKVGAGLYKYEAVCPDHGDRYIDFCTLSAYVARDGVVEIEEVTWDNATNNPDELDSYDPTKLSKDVLMNRVIDE